MLMKGLTRREFFNQCSKDTFKDILKSWYSFKDEVDEKTRLSCEEIAFQRGGKAKDYQKFLRIKKGGI
jgi:hypothetical protein